MKNKSNLAAPIPSAIQAGFVRPNFDAGSGDSEIYRATQNAAKVYETCSGLNWGSGYVVLQCNPSVIRIYRYQWFYQLHIHSHERSGGDGTSVCANINHLYSATIDWHLIELHLPAMLQVAVLIKACKISLSATVRHLGAYNH